MRGCRGNVDSARQQGWWSGRYRRTISNQTTCKKPTTPLKVKKRPAVKRELDIVVSRLFIVNSWKEIALDIFWQALNTIQRKRPILNPEIKKPIIIAKARFGRFYGTVRGMTRCGGGNSPTLSHKEMVPEASLSLSVSEINWANGLQDK